MQDIQKELVLARAELANIKTANKEAAIAAAFKRTARPSGRSLVAAAKAEYLAANAEYFAAKAAELDAMDAVTDAARRFDALGEGNTMRRWNVINRLYEAVDEARRRMSVAFNKEIAAQKKCDAAVVSYRPSFRDTKEAEARVEALEAMLPKPAKPEYMTRSERWEYYARINEEQVAHGEARIDLIRSRMAQAEAVIPGEAQEWLPADEDEAVETVAWLHAKHAAARDPRRKENRRNYMTQLDWAKWQAGNEFPAKRGRYWGHDSWWYEGHCARAKAAEAAAWER